MGMAETQSPSTFAFHLEAEMQKAAAQPMIAGKATHTLVAYHNFKQLMIYMQPGSRWNEHSTAGRISLQVLRGKIRLMALNQQHELSPGDLFSLDSNTKHDVEGVEESWFLLTVARCD